MPPIPDKDKCKTEAEDLADTIQRILESPRYQDLLNAFENTHLPTAKKEFKEILDEIGIRKKLKDKLEKGAFSNHSVSFNWF